MLTLTRDMHPSIYTNQATGDVSITMILSAHFLGIDFPHVTHIDREAVFVVLRTGTVYNSTLGMYGWAVGGHPLRRFGDYLVYKIDQTGSDEVYVGSQPIRPPAFECEAEFRGILTGTVRACDVRQFLVEPPTPALRKDAVVVDYGLSFSELPVLHALDERIMNILHTAAGIRSP